MKTLKEKLFEKIEAWRPRTIKLLKEYGDKKIDDITVAQIIGGMRGVKCLISDISSLDPNEGIRFRGYTISEILEKLPRPENAEIPCVEAHFYLLLTGEFPTSDNIKQVRGELKKRSKLPTYVYDVINAMPKESHPMAMFSAAILSMQKESVFARKYLEGIKKTDYWQFYYEDTLQLIAKVPEIAAYIYRKRYKKGVTIEGNPDLDMGANFAKMMGIGKPYDDVSRLYFITHSDHESGNVSAHTGHLVSSALSDIYYSTSAMLNGLAGPLHGLANQEALRWLQELMKKMGDKTPTKEEMQKFVWDTLNSGQVIPGYGHAVLRKTDPRYQSQRDFCLKHLPNDPVFKYVNLLYEVVPDILRKHGRAKNPWPNVDGQSGVIQWYYGLKEYDFYTVLFGIARTVGVSANLIWDRALAYPIERPKSLTTEIIENLTMKN